MQHTLRALHPNWFSLHFRAHGGAIRTAHDWFENFDLALERERGLPTNDAHLCVGIVDFDLQPGMWMGISASLDKPASPYLEEAMRRFHNHDAGLLRRAKVLPPELLSAPVWLDQLLLAADTFLFARPLPNVAPGKSSSPAIRGSAIGGATP